MILRKLRQVLVEVEHDGNGNNQGYREEVVTYELLDDIPVQSLDVSQWVEIPEHLEETQFVPHPSQHLGDAVKNGNQPTEAMGNGSAHLQSSAMFSDVFKIFHHLK